MKKIIFALFCLFSVDIHSAPSNLNFGQDNARLIVNNRILATVNGKIITTHDVMKKMDILFLKQFPQYTSSPTARYKFYMANWKTIFEELVNKELIMADAEESKIVISAGDIRQEMEEMFGPNIIANLDKIGMTFDEASEILKGEITIRRMVAQNVHARSIRIATPNKTRQAYEEFIRKPENIQPAKWTYRVITIKDRNQQKASSVADAAYQLLTEESIAPDNLVEALKERQLIGRKTKVTLSNDIVNHELELSDAYKEVLAALDTGMISKPSIQKSRTDNITPYRIFYVKEKTPGGTPGFKELESRLKDDVMNDIINTETDSYIRRLRKHFHITDTGMVPDDYQPFALK